MSHELPVCLLLPAVSALPLPEQSLKHMLLWSAEQPERHPQPNCCKEQSCQIFFPALFVIFLPSWVSIRESDGLLCNKAALSDAAPDLANMAALRK